MGRLRRGLDRLEPLFRTGGRFERLHPVYEMIDTLLYAPADLTRGAPHVRDALDLKRLMTVFLVALLPCLFVGMWNTGYQANLAIAELGLDAASGWRSGLLSAFGAGHDADSVYDNLLYGLSYFAPVFIVTFLAAGFWSLVFASLRDQDINEGFLVTSTIYVLILPAGVPLWQVAIGISFGIVIGKEIFGGTGKNFLHPALLGKAFLYFAYPAQHSGENIWVAVDGYSGATALALGATDGLPGILAGGFTWMQAFLGDIPGSLGETSALACLVGAFILVYAGVASWRIMLACVIGLVVPAILFSGIDSPNPMFALPWFWHLVLGGFAFGVVFIATDPASSPDTLAGHWVFGLLIGFMTWVIRVINPGFPEGIMLAIIFGSIFAPIIDYIFIRANIRRRERRSA